MRVLNLAAAVAVAALLAAPTAVAQQRGGSVVVVNFQRVMSESAMGRDMQTRLGTIGTQLQQEDTALNPEGQAIQTEEQRLETASRGKTPAQIQADPTLGPQWTALQTVAWTTMLANNLRTEFVTKAVSNTFDGEHPCPLCKALAAAK